MDFIRRTVVHLLMILALFGLNLVLTNDQVRADSPACEQIKIACRDAGFVLGAGPRDGLLVACFNPIVHDTAQPKAASRRLPTVNAQWIAACRAGNDSALVATRASAPLVPSADGQTIYDPNLNVTWLADGNLAAEQKSGIPSITKDGPGASNITQDGLMHYAAALRWVAAMNGFDNGAGYLGHNNWQLPTAPAQDKTCARTGRHGESFGFNCSGSALGSLYYGSLGLREPNTAVRMSGNKAGPFHDFQAYLYWSGSAAADPKQGFVSFSFNSGFPGANVPLNYLYILPLIKGKLPDTPSAAGKGLQVNPGGETIYDPVAQITWLADANLAAKQTFGVAGINPDGAMDHAAAVQWIEAMNKADQGRGYLGQKSWQLPETGPPDPSCSMKGTTGFDCTGSAMGELFYKKLGFRRGEPVAAAPDVKVGPFHNIQPYLYWACEGETAGSVCQSGGSADGFEWNFSFGNGFEGTNLVGNYLYVIVYYPGASTDNSR